MIFQTSMIMFQPLIFRGVLYLYTGFPPGSSTASFPLKSYLNPKKSEPSTIFQMRCEPGCLGYTRNYTTQSYKDYSKPIWGFTWTNQYNEISAKGFPRCSNVQAMAAKHAAFAWGMDLVVLVLHYSQRAAWWTPIDIFFLLEPTKICATFGPQNHETWRF